MSRVANCDRTKPAGCSAVNHWRGTDMRVRLSCQNDHEMRHYAFERTTRLPIGYFAKPDRSGYILLAGAILAVVLLATLFAIDRFI